MLAPPIAAASFSSLPPPYLAVVKQPTEEALVLESTTSQLIFPNEFPYEFETFSSAFTSPDDSTETEDETSDDEDDFFVGLTRRLSSQRLSSPPLPLVSDKSEVKPQVSGLASPNGPLTQEDSLKLISAAAGEVAKLIDAKPTSRTNQNPNFVVPSPQNAAFCQYYYNWLWRPQYFPPNASPYPVFAAPIAFKPPSAAGTSVLAAPNAVKTPPTGTGVFIPKDYSNKKSGGGRGKSTKKVVQQNKTKVEEVSTEGSKIDPECLVTFPSLKPERHN